MVSSGLGGQPQFRAGQDLRQVLGQHLEQVLRQVLGQDLGQVLGRAPLPDKCSCTFNIAKAEGWQLKDEVAVSAYFQSGDW